MLDCEAFIAKARDIYRYRHFINDAGGSLCELQAPRVIESLAEHTIIVYIAADQAMEQTLIARQRANPKPLYYQACFFEEALTRYLSEQGLASVQEIVPDDFVQWVFPRLVAHRRPAYQRIADQYGYTISASEAETVRDESDFIDIVTNALDRTPQPET